MKGQNHPFILYRRENSVIGKKQSQSNISMVTPKYAHLDPNGGYIGLDLGSKKTIAKIRYLPALNYNYLMLGGKFQGSNKSMENGYEDICTITEMPHVGWNEINIYIPRPYRFLRYYGPDGSRSVVSKIEYYTLGSDSPDGKSAEVKLKGVPFAAAPENPLNDPAMIYADGPDVIITFKDYAKKTGCPFYVQTSTKSEGFPHQHDFVEFMLIAKGFCFHYCNGEIINLYAGDFLIIPPGTDHYYFGRVNLTVINILAYPEELGDYFLPQLSSLAHFSEIIRHNLGVRPGMFSKFHLGIENLKQLLPLINEIEMELSAKATGYQAACHYLFGMIMVQLERLCQSDRSEQAEASESGIRWVLQTMKILENNYKTINNVGEILSSLPVGYSRLAHLFKQETGLSIYDFLLRIRIGHVCMDLIRTRDDTSRISSAAGFKNYGSFCRKFTQLTGYTPLEFRRRFSVSKLLNPIE